MFLFLCTLDFGASVVLDVLWFVIEAGQAWTNQHKTSSLLPKMRSVYERRGAEVRASARGCHVASESHSVVARAHHETLA